jgi:hypothetical protein
MTIGNASSSRVFDGVAGNAIALIAILWMKRKISSRNRVDARNRLRGCMLYFAMTAENFHAMLSRQRVCQTVNREKNYKKFRNCT